MRPFWTIFAFASLSARERIIIFLIIACELSPFWGEANFQWYLCDFYNESVETRTREREKGRIFWQNLLNGKKSNFTHRPTSWFESWVFHSRFLRWILILKSRSRRLTGRREWQSVRWGFWTVTSFSRQIDLKSSNSWARTSLDLARPYHYFQTLSRNPWSWHGWSVAQSWFRMVEMVWNRGMAPIQSQEDLTPTKKQTKARRIEESWAHRVLTKKNQSVSFEKRGDIRTYLKGPPVFFSNLDRISERLTADHPKNFYNSSRNFTTRKSVVQVIDIKNRETVSRLLFPLYSTVRKAQ